ncbi:MAG: hypothetical protein WC935_01555 [Thermoleophilia bacterium]
MSGKKKSVEQKRFAEATQSLEKMQKEIAPFLRNKKYMFHSSRGEWNVTSNLVR